MGTKLTGGYYCVSKRFHSGQRLGYRQMFIFQFQIFILVVKQSKKPEKPTITLYFNIEDNDFKDFEADMTV